jgi:homoserine kinase
MRCDIPSGLGANSSGTVAVTSVEILETPPGGGLQASVKTLTEFTSHTSGKDVPDNVKAALRRVRTKGNDS